MADVMLEKRNGFSLVWILIYRHSKSFFTSDLEILNISSRHSNFAHSFDFYCLNSFESFNVSFQFTPWRVMNGEQNLSWNVYYFYSFTSIQNSTSLQKTETLNVRTSELIPKGEKTSTIPNITFTILHFSHRKTYFNCHPECFGVYFFMKPLERFTIVHSIPIKV